MLAALLLLGAGTRNSGLRPLRYAGGVALGTLSLLGSSTAFETGRIYPLPGLEQLPGDGRCSSNYRICDDGVLYWAVGKQDTGQVSIYTSGDVVMVFLGPVSVNQIYC